MQHAAVRKRKCIIGVEYLLRNFLFLIGVLVIILCSYDQESVIFIAMICILRHTEMLSIVLYKATSIPLQLLNDNLEFHSIPFSLIFIILNLQYPPNKKYCTNYRCTWTPEPNCVGCPQSNRFRESPDCSSGAKHL